MDKLYWLDQIQPQDRAKVGEKAFSLSQILQQGYPVVPGFVITDGVLQQFLETLNSSESLIADLPHSSLHLDVSNWQQLQQVARRLRQEIISADIPSQWSDTIFLAAQSWQTNCLIFRPTAWVNSSGIHSLGKISGLLESVFCDCTPEAISNALKLTWSQLFRARSLLYWHKAGINLQKVSLAVLVQPVEQAIASGYLIADTLEWKIAATWGLGLGLTYGDVVPDTYYMSPGTAVVTEKQLGNKMLAYRVNHHPRATSEPVSPTSSLFVDDHCLSIELLTVAQQEQYALNETFLEQIIALGNQLVGQLGTKLTLKWTIIDKTPTPQLYITQVKHLHTHETPIYLLKGIGASTGRIRSNACVVLNSPQKPQKIPDGAILVTPEITPHWLPLLQEIAGIVTEEGGLTCHAAILSRELNIPAIVNVKNATNIIRNGEKLLIDGDRGEIHRLGVDVREADALPYKAVETQLLHHQPLLNKSLTNPFLPPIATKLLLNLSQPHLIPQVKNLPVDGVGLLRSELMVLNILEGKHPRNWLLDGCKDELLKLWSDTIIQFAGAFTPRPVFYRSLDWLSPNLGTFNNGDLAKKESILGERGASSYLRNPALFELELQALALVQSANYDNVHLLLPFVRTVEEFVFCRHKVEQAGLTRIPHFQLWIMAEVPSILFLLPEYIKAGVGGISIGTNDLAQLILGVNREQGELAQLLDERHPAIMGAIAQIIQIARAGGIPCSICGQAPALYPEIIDHLVAWGITSISVEPQAVEQTIQAIARAEQRLILAAARKQIHLQSN